MKKTTMLLTAAALLITSALYLSSDHRKMAMAGDDMKEAEERYEYAVAELASSEIAYATKKLDYYKMLVADVSTDDINEFDYLNIKGQIKRLSEKLGLEYTPEYNNPYDLFYVFLRLDGEAYVTQTPRDHYANNGLLATDIGTGGQKLIVRAPDYLNKEVEWDVEFKEYLNSSGETAILTNEDLGIRWLIGHVHKMEGVTTARTGEAIAVSGGEPGEEGQGVSSGPHVHLEFYTRGPGGKWFISEYKLGESNKHEQWNPPSDWISDDSATVFLTGYNWGDPNQNDEEPCVGASGERMCERIDESKPWTPENTRWLSDPRNTIALTSDVRARLGISFGDTVHMQSENPQCNGEFRVIDEMNKRFREWCIIKPFSQGYCIKGDIGAPLGESTTSCLVTITK